LAMTFSASPNYLTIILFDLIRHDINKIHKRGERLTNLPFNKRTHSQKFSA
jgi:hypothetical protein